jgi:predicted DNA binding CopG/RHH family protein
MPKHKSEAEAQEFWSRADSTEYLDWSKAQITFFPNLKPSSRTISIRLPESLIESIKVLANRQDVPYQSMLKVLLADKVREMLNAKKSKGKAA